ncbi:MAG: PaaI family thioesterase [Acidimicrobiales bacterium]|nr:PaaI family thioesterase [Acidimicrobiales bacterium]
MAESYNLEPPRPLRDFPFIERAGLELLHLERGRAVLRLPFEPNINHVGMVYAGALFTLAEMPGGVLFVSAFDVARFYPIVGDMQVRFMRPAMTSVTVDAGMTDAEINRITQDLELQGRAKYVLEQELHDEHGTLVATTSATYFGRSF